MEELSSYVLEKIILDQTKPIKSKIRIIELCIKVGCDLNQNESEALVDAIEDDNHELVNFLLESGIDIRAQNDYLVFRTCSCGRLEMLQLLVEYGLNLFIEDNYPLVTACHNHSFRITKYLLEMGIDCTHPDNNPIKYAFLSSGGLEIKKLLLENGADPNAKYLESCCNYKRTLLEESVTQGDYDSCELLLEFGADINLCEKIINGHLNNYKWLVNNVSSSAIKENLEKIVGLLLEYGVDLSGAMLLYQEKS